MCASHALSLPPALVSPSLPLSSLPPQGLSSAARRKRLDEVPSRWLCSVIGTCLTLADLRKLAIKVGLALPPDASDYRLHGAIVHLASENKVLGKTVARLLDKRHAATVSRITRTGDEAGLARLWADARNSGDIPGAYWALMTHPLDCQALRERVYGEVHMLSHLSGAAQRSDLQRTAGLERQVADLSAELTRLRADLTVVRQERDAARRDASVGEIQRRRADQLAERLAELESGSALTAAQQSVRQAQAEKDSLTRALDAAQRRLEQMQEQRQKDEADRRGLEQRLADAELRWQEARRAAPADLLAANRSGSGEVTEGVDLARRQILYVGGIGHAARHLEDVVKACNGVFVHHDGGLDDGCPRLAGAVSCADVVFCPVTCVSHEAVTHLKRNCRKACKPFVPLPNHSVSTFRRALKLVGAPS
ncbi:DUF2325 domain-containing protein [Novispirillum itersonii]|uniref:DUF2325 domain-containing protein n=1 Tax=Novispirillum itersonii TaxID=189 RepID=UPI00037AC584|nr:DUF2325 domain-containing protein [Novispirillum itersonii]